MTRWLPTFLLQPGKALSVSRYVDDDTGFQEVLDDIEKLENFSKRNESETKSSEEVKLSNGFKLQRNVFADGSSLAYGEEKASLTCLMRLSGKVDKANAQGRKFKSEQANEFIERARGSDFSTHLFIYQNNAMGTPRPSKPQNQEEGKYVVEKLMMATRDLRTVFKN